MAETKPITFYNHPLTANPRKVRIIMEELDVPYKLVDIADPKADSFTAINPNGRLPAIEDPNTGLTLWESGAIIEYLLETYDKEGKLAVHDSKDKWLAKQYLFFQVSGQGPYIGQMMWYNAFDKTNPSAKARYEEQTERVIMVVDKILKGKQYLVAERLSYADLAFVSYFYSVQAGFKEQWENWEVEKKYPDFLAWHTRLLERPSVKKILDIK